MRSDLASVDCLENNGNRASIYNCIIGLPPGPAYPRPRPLLAGARRRLVHDLSGIVRYHARSRLNGLGQSSLDHHSRRMLDLRNELDRVGFSDFIWTSYILPTWRDIEPDWVTEDGEIETWRASVPIVLFMFFRYHHVDRVKRQFGSEQAIPLDPVNLDGFFDASARGEDKWWPTELQYWYNFWNNRRARGYQIQIVYTPYTSMPTKEYID
ncbi:hypothetical protein PIB30_090354 [Stylosanthes scabra]|uniref:Aminotransferase-like plant mobile domain-containing protein n=1 Tax=Stylosanthes scabra TaxID=79078 RepID=A0ABU6SUN1_9FABA|nr:hypothetical protein [Stylosanthes scabra]